MNVMIDFSCKTSESAMVGIMLGISRYATTAYATAPSPTPMQTARANFAKRVSFVLRISKDATAISACPSAVGVTKSRAFECTCR